MNLVRLLAFHTLFAATGVIGCGTPSVPPVQKGVATEIEEVDLAALVADPGRFQRARIRVKGICRIEFEGNALYVDRPSFAQRNSRQALWLDLGWPVRLGGTDLTGRLVQVEGVFDGTRKGSEGAFAGTLIQIEKIEPFADAPE